MKKALNKFDDNLVKSANKILNNHKRKKLKNVNSALRKAIDRFIIKRFELKHQRGYIMFPPSNDEFNLWGTITDLGRYMKNDCAINFDHIQTVSKNKIGSIITQLSASRLSEVRRAIIFAFDL